MNHSPNMPSSQPRRAAYAAPVWIALACVTGLYAAIWALSQHKLIYTDEIVFALDFGRISAGDWNALEIPHPPLYVALGSLATRVWGYTLPAMRVVGGAGYLLTLWLIPLVCSRLADNADQAKRASLIAILAWGIHPLALQGSLLLDIDNTLFPPALLLLTLAVSRAESGPRAGRIILIAGSFALMMWVKLLPSSLLIAGAILLTYVLRRQGFASTAASIALGALIFAVSFGIFAAITHFPVEVVWSTFARVQTVAGGFERALRRLIMGGGITAMWAGIPLLILFAGIVYQRALRIVRGQTPNVGDSLILYTVSGFAIFTLGNELPMGFPRYHYPLVLCIVILVSLTLADINWDRKRIKLALAASALGCATYFALVAPDPLLPQYALTFETNALSDRLNFGLRAQLTTLLLPFGLVTMICWVMVGNLRPALRPAVFSFCVGLWAVTSLSHVQAPYATIYEYGRVGGRDMGDLIAQKTQPDDTIIAPKEILWASQRQGDFVVQLLACPQCTAQSMLDHFQTVKPAAYVLTTKEDGRYTHITRDARFVSLLRQCFDPPVTIGSYIAYFRTQSDCGQP